MNIDLTQIIIALMGLLSAIITGFVIPWIKGKLDDRQLELLNGFIRIGVYAAEQLISPEKGEEKLKYVFDFLKAKGFQVDEPQVRTMIEAAVLELHRNLAE